MFDEYIVCLGANVACPRWDPLWDVTGDGRVEFPRGFKPWGENPSKTTCAPVASKTSTLEQVEIVFAWVKSTLTLC